MPDILARQRQMIGTSADWVADDLVLGDGEIGLERLTGGGVAFKVGNALNRYSELPYSFGTVSWGYIDGDITNQADLQAALALKADLHNAVFTGVIVLPPTTNIKTVNGNGLIGYGNVDITATVLWGDIVGTLADQTDLQAALDLKAPKAGPTFTGNVTLPATTSIGPVSNLEIGYLDGVTGPIQPQIDSKQTTLVSGTTIKTVNGNTLLGPGNVATPDIAAVWGNISGSMASQTDLAAALNTKQDVLVSGTTIKTVNGTSLLGSGNVSTPDVAAVWGNVSGLMANQTDLTSALALKAPLASPTFTGTVTLPSTTNIKTVNGNSLIGVGDVVIAATAVWGTITGTLSAQTDLSNALALKAPLANPTFTGTVTLPTTTNLKTINGASLVGSGDIALPTAPVSPANGGTGITSYTAGDLLVASGPATLGRLPAVVATNVLLSNGAGASPIWGRVILGVHTTGTLSVNSVTGTKAEFNGACSDGDFVYVGDTVPIASVGGYSEGTWTPVVGAVSGAITAATATGKYTKVGNLVTARISVTITTNGTGAGALLVSAPPLTVITGGDGLGRQGGTNYGLSASIAAGATQFDVRRFDNDYPGGDGATLTATISYFV